MEVAKLPILEVTKEFLERVGEDTGCAVCREDLVLGDKLQEMPCKHNFHPACLKPWLVGPDLSLGPRQRTCTKTFVDHAVFLS